MPWALGVALVEEARRRELLVVIDINRSGQQLFPAAWPGTAPDNDPWIARKSAAGRRFGYGSLYLGQQRRDAGTTLSDKYAVPAEEYAAHGGAFPLVVRGVGPVGVVTVSGLPQVEDHPRSSRCSGPSCASRPDRSASRGPAGPRRSRSPALAAAEQI